MPLDRLYDEGLDHQHERDEGQREVPARCGGTFFAVITAWIPAMVRIAEAGIELPPDLIHHRASAQIINGALRVF
jgi:hypothetical protein